jgi:hypothetical protein
MQTTDAKAVLEIYQAGMDAGNASLWAFLRDSLTHTTYPLTPLINVLYGVTFVVDIFYIVLLHRMLRRNGIAPFERL